MELCSGADNSLSSRIFRQYIAIRHSLITPSYYFIFLCHLACRTLCILSRCESSLHKQRSEKPATGCCPLVRHVNFTAQRHHAVHVRLLSRWHNSLCTDISD